MTQYDPGLLDDVLADTKTSDYIDDDYYAMLRHDLLEWDAAGAVLTEPERAQYESLILHESWLLDRRRFEEWYQLYARECLYWVPAVNDLPTNPDADPQRRVSIACDDRRRMGDRIAWLRTGVAYSQLPPSYTTHANTGFVRVPTVRPGEIKIRSQFTLQEVRLNNPLQTMSGWMGHVLTREDDAVRIARKIVCLVDADRSHHNLTFLI